MIRALIDPTTQKVACVLLQAAHGGDRRACNIVGADRWEVSPSAPFVWFEGSLDQWRDIANGTAQVRCTPQAHSEKDSI